MSAILKDPLLGVRRMTGEDVDAVMANEVAAYTHPWTKNILRDCLRVGYGCYVCEMDGEIVGHAVMSVAVGEAHLLNLCIAPRWQGRGLGRRLLGRVIRMAAERQADTLFLEVRASNVAAQALYESEGFGEIGRRPGYYPDEGGREDALVFARALL